MYDLNVYICLSRSLRRNGTRCRSASASLSTSRPWATVSSSGSPSVRSSSDRTCRWRDYAISWVWQHPHRLGGVLCVENEWMSYYCHVDNDWVMLCGWNAWVKLSAPWSNIWCTRSCKQLWICTPGTHYCWVAWKDEKRAQGFLPLTIWGIEPPTSGSPVQHPYHLATSS